MNKASLREVLARSVGLAASRLTAGAWAQSLLDRAVRAAQRLQGIGAGSDVNSSGELSVISRLKAPRQPASGPLCIFDVGANTGEFLMLASARLSGTDFHVHAFEPARAAFARLCVQAGNDTRVTLNNFALGRERGEAELYCDEAGSGLASFTRRRLKHFGIEMKLSETVRVETIDEYCADRGIARIDLLKLDVEGHELDVLHGSLRMLRSSAIGMITFEFGGCNIDTRTFLQDFFYFFADHDMRIARILPSGAWRDISSYDEIQEQFRTTNFVCYPLKDFSR